MRKNIYEELLFKSEDEKYEFDLNIRIYQRTIKVLIILIKFKLLSKLSSPNMTEN